MMKLGFLQVYNEANWVGFAIDQAMNLCDNLLICEGSQFVAFPDIPERSDDGTLDIIADKKKQYPKRIEVINTIRKYESYRYNQCANFTLGITFCSEGDYFLQLDADDFFSDAFIAKASELMKEGKADLIRVNSHSFAFGFKWIADFGKQSPRPVIVKKTKALRFIPTHKILGEGSNVHIEKGISRFHYVWLKPRERMRIRMRTSGMYPRMLEWLEKYWDSFKLEDGKEYPCYKGNFTLHRYEGKHPSILDNHPWRDVEDIRRMQK